MPRDSRTTTRPTRRNATTGRRRTSRPEAVRFSRKLVLYQWLLDLFGVERFDQIAEHLCDENLEGLDYDNIHRFHRALCLHLPSERRPELPDELLLEYDQAIVGVTLRLNERRITRGKRPIVWKYFQYLGLLFTEIYLDRYFRDPQALIAALNKRISAFNEGVDNADRISPLDERAEAWPQLNKIAFWMATGSGKTLLMHAHILQYRRFLETHGRARELNRIILLTPNEGLSAQHLREFETSGIDAEIFNKDGRGLFAGQAVEILEVTRLKDEMGMKTVAVDAFESNNLVLVDEGHRGASAGGEGVWMKYRNLLCQKGFSFEYSATFGQAVKGDRRLTDLYARSTLIDYSYRWFHADGFGKDYRITNLNDDGNAEWMKRYLTACLLAFFQQQRLYRDRKADLQPFDIEKPLWIFVGGSVTATLAAREASDILEILRFLQQYVSDRARSIGRIRQVLDNGLVTADGKNLFAGQFGYLNTISATPAKIFGETLVMLFNAPAGGALHVENLRGVRGEVALRVGDNEPFGVINVGDDTKLMRRCDENGLEVAEREFTGSLFQQIRRPESRIHVLIGSRKFTEGWNSWRVSTMGLMNVGRSEGAQIIQLFGRGVRLKGYDMSLKRSARAPLPHDLERPRHIELLETLQIFGVHADYMARFRDFLLEEGLAPNEDRLEIVLPIISSLPARSLKTVRLKREINGISTESGDPFRKLGPMPTLTAPASLGGRTSEYFDRNPVVINWYPKIQAMKSDGIGGGADDEAPNQAYFFGWHIAMLYLDGLYFELERFKAERAWHNLNITRSSMREILEDTTWYRLLIPASELVFDSLEKVRVWQEVALALLRKYAERYYAFRKREWELPHLEYSYVTERDPNFPSVVRQTGAEYGYRILIERSQDAIIAKLRELEVAIRAGDLKPLSFQGIEAIWFDRHLYQPLLSAAHGAVKIAPVPLNKGERRFVEDLKGFYDGNGARLANRELYLLRNQSKGRGVGFFEAGNFHPDFIVWQLEADRQQISFVDPKGIRNVPAADPKIRFYETIKELEQRLGDSRVSLDAYIVSNTPSHVMKKQWGMGKPEMTRRHILFQEEDKISYIGSLLGT